MGFKGTVLRLTGLATLAGIAAMPAMAAEDFYKGKQITFISSTDAGTTYDTYARVVAEHIVQYIPGSPTAIVQNMAGASGLKASNFVYNVAPKDGTVIAAVHSHIPGAPLLSPNEAQFDVTKIGWIGSVTKEPFIGYVWNNAPALTYEDMKKTQVIVGGQSVGSTSIDLAILSNELFGTKLKIITGYKSAPEVKLAMEKGEVHGTFGNAYTALMSEQPDWVRDGKVKIVIQHGFTKHPKLPDVPLFVDQAKTPEDRQVLDLLLARQETGKPFFMGPGVPPERLAILRKAFDQVIKDPKFIAAIEKSRLAVDGPLTGQEVTELAGRLAQTPPATVKRMESLLTKFKEKS
jgi:tripartite-type tricarboxylate transporter receptor subunit TctC